MIFIEIEDLDFYDDASALVRSFYPRTDVEIKKTDRPVTESDLVITPQIPKCETGDKKAAHDLFKRNLYEKLSKETGKRLPWGYLTGVRPSKIAYAMIENGFDEQAITERFTKDYLVQKEKANLAFCVADTEHKILDEMDYKNGCSLYVGIPFCPTTCLYCSFTSYPLAAYSAKVDDYLDALLKEIRYVARTMEGQRLDTIYVGGGTPTTLSSDHLDRLFTVLEECLDLSSVRELTVEAGRPDSITREKLETLKRHNVSRISINPQTMNDATLALIGRKHNASQVVEAFELARSVGFDNINMDMILGLPGENQTMVENTLKQIQKLGPESLTVHSLAIKRAAALNIWREKYADMRLDNSQELVSMAAEYAKKCGMKPYYMYRQKNMTGNLENVGYAKPGFESLYNILIMEEKQTIMAVGAGASSKIVFCGGEEANGRIERIENVKDVDNYIERIDEMIERKKEFFSKNGEELYANMIEDFKSGIAHGVLVGNLAYALARKLGLGEEEAYDIKLAGLVHDVGKLELSQYLYGRNTAGLTIEEVKYMRMHSKIGYEFLKRYDFPKPVLDAVLSHHECYDGSGYPSNLAGEKIPFSARVIRVVDEFAALISDRPYRKAFDYDTAVEIMIEENKNFDMQVFIGFQRLIHEPETIELIRSSDVCLDDLEIRDILNL